VAGAAVAANDENSPTLTFAATQAGAILGTASYMALEQARGKNADKRAARLMSVPVETGTTFQTGMPRELFAAPARSNFYAAAPDFSRFLIPVAVDAKGPQIFDVILNWTGLLKGR
jgi:hypothetical protein